MFGGKALVRALEEIRLVAQRKLDEGQTKFVVTVYLGAAGVSGYKMRRMQTESIALLERLGLSVVTINKDEWEHNVHLTVETYAPVGDTSSIRLDHPTAQNPSPPPIASVQGFDRPATPEPAELRAMVQRFHDQFSAGNYLEVWEERSSYGYSLDRDSLRGDDRFWIDALPTLAALRLGQREHPLVAGYAGLAEDSQDYLNEKHRAAVQEINERYFAP